MGVVRIGTLEGHRQTVPTTLALCNNPGDDYPAPVMIGERVIAAYDECATNLATIRWSDPVHRVYNPLDYARAPWRAYISQYGNSSRRVLFLGMNPGPWGMAQTGVPFGEIEAVRSWMGIDEPVGSPPVEHPKRPITGFACARSEVSGRRLWGLFAERYGPAERFFADHIVLNYCPLVFMAESGRNITPDKLRADERTAIYRQCDAALGAAIEAYQPAWVVGVGAFAAARAEAVVRSSAINATVTRVLHPSPASPRANRGWSAHATAELEYAGVWLRS